MDVPTAAKSIFEQAILSQKRPHTVVDMPGYPGVRVAILVPSDEECAEAQAAALQYLTDGGLRLDALKLSIATEGSLFESEYERQLLVRVLRNPANTELPFGTIESLRRGLNAQTRRVLMRQLAAFVDERSPERKLGDDPQKAIELIEEIKKKQEDFPMWLHSCDFGTLAFITLSLVDRFLKPTGEPSTDTGP